MGLTRIRADQISNIDYKQAVRVITVSNVTLSGGAPSSVDGVSLSAGDRVLVQGQSTGSQNGIYVVSTLGTGSNGTWVRSADGNENGEIEAGMIIMVTEGDTYKDTQWKLTTNNPITIGTTALVFEQNSAFAFGNVYANGTAILASSVGDTIELVAGTNITITGNGTAKTVTFAATGALTPTLIESGTSNVNVTSSGGNVTVGVGGTNNIAIFSTGGANITGYLAATGNISGNYVLGNGAFLEGLPAGYANSDVATYLASGTVTTDIKTTGAISATGNVTGGNLLGTIRTASQTNITAVGTLTSLSVSGNVQGGNLRTAGLISATGTVTGSTFVGNGSGLSALAGANVTGTVANAAYATSAGSASTATTAGTVTTAAQGNITSVGTLTSLSVSGNVQGGNLRTAGLISATGTVTGSTFVGSGASLSAIPGANVTGTVANAAYATSAGSASTATTAGTVTTAAQANITSVGTLTSLSVSGNIDAGNVTTTTATVGGILLEDSTDRSGLLEINRKGVTAWTGVQMKFSGTALMSVMANETNGGIYDDVNGEWILYYTENGDTAIYQNGTARITATSAGATINGTATATTLSATGNVQAGNVRTTGLVSATGTVTGTTFIGIANQAKYADLAEYYIADADYPPGTVLEFGGNSEVTQSTTSHVTSIAGTVSDLPAYIMNSGLDHPHRTPVALMGRVPCRVVGVIRKGDRLAASAIPGVATALDPAQYQPGCIIGKALEDYNSDEPGIIEVVVGRL